jgi:DNA-binding FadR family transcriptional regulator
VGKLLFNLFECDFSLKIVVANAISSRDADAAEQAMRLHLVAVQKRVIEHLHPLTAAV